MASAPVETSSTAAMATTAPTTYAILSLVVIGKITRLAVKTETRAPRTTPVTTVDASAEAGTHVMTGMNAHKTAAIRSRAASTPLRRERPAPRQALNAQLVSVSVRFANPNQAFHALQRWMWTYAQIRTRQEPVAAMGIVHPTPYIRRVAVVIPATAYAPVALVSVSVSHSN